MRAAKGAGSGGKRNKPKVYRIKVISMGEQACGKSCLIKRYCEEKFIQKYIPTIGVDYGVKPVKLGEYEVRVNLWDLAGAADYEQVRSEFYKDAQGCLLVYDVANRASYDALPQWVSESREMGAENMVIVVAGTKSDLLNRKVTEKEAKEWTSAQGLLHFEVSAQSSQNVKALFASLFARLLATAPGIPQELTQLAVQEARVECKGAWPA